MQYMTIPLDDSEVPWRSFRMTLSGVRYNLELQYNVRVDRWFLSIYDAAQNPILMSIPLLIGRALTVQYPTLPLPVGVLFVVDNSNKGTQPGLASFHLDHELIYGDPTVASV